MGPPKVDPNEVRFIKLKVFGGEPGPASVMAPKLGPMGLNAKVVGESIVKEGSSKWKGIRIMVVLRCQNRVATVSVTPTAGSMIVQALGDHARDRKKVKNVTRTGNLSMD